MNLSGDNKEISFQSQSKEHYKDVESSKVSSLNVRDISFIDGERDVRLSNKEEGIHLKSDSEMKSSSNVPELNGKFQSHEKETIIKDGDTRYLSDAGSSENKAEISVVSSKSKTEVLGDSFAESPENEDSQKPVDLKSRLSMLPPEMGTKTALKRRHQFHPRKLTKAI